MTRKTHCCQEGHETRRRGSILGESREERHHAPLSSVRASKSKMAPRGVVEGQVGRWVPDTLWHVCTKSPIMSGLDTVHFVGEGLTWQVGRDANDHFLRLYFLFFCSMKAKGWQAKVAKAFSAVTLDVWPLFGWVDGLVTDRFLWLNWQSTCKQIDEGKVNMFEILEVWWKWEILLFWLARHQAQMLVHINFWIAPCTFQHIQTALKLWLGKNIFTSNYKLIQ